jgi:hypothetical protein
MFPLYVPEISIQPATRIHIMRVSPEIRIEILVAVGTEMRREYTSKSAASIRFSNAW